MEQTNIMTVINGYRQVSHRDIEDLIVDKVYILDDFVLLFFADSKFSAVRFYEDYDDIESNDYEFEKSDVIEGRFLRQFKEMGIIKQEELDNIRTQKEADRIKKIQVEKDKKEKNEKAMYEKLKLKYEDN